MNSELEQFYDDLTFFNEKQNILWNLRNKKFYKQNKLHKITSYTNFLAYHANEYFDFDEDPRCHQEIIVCENSEKVFDYL